MKIEISFINKFFYATNYWSTSSASSITWLAVDDDSYKSFPNRLCVDESRWTAANWLLIDQGARESLTWIMYDINPASNAVKQWAIYHCTFLGHFFGRVNLYYSLRIKKVEIWYIWAIILSISLCLLNELN